VEIQKCSVMEKVEIRSLGVSEAEVRAEGENRTISGYGVVFNSESRDLNGFTEVILPEAIEDVLPRSDVFALLNHQFEKGVLARCAYGQGSMTLQVDNRGVKYSFKAPKFNLGEEVLEGVERGDIRSSSFAFTIAPGGERWDKRDDGTWLRTVSKFDRIFDMSPCYTGAYADTAVAKRSLDAIKEMSEPIKEEVKPPVTVEVPDEPIISFQRSAATDLELAYRQYIQESEFNELTR